ncbi:MAG: complex I NDUFA9 subunit family protein [Armatimonadetes bacterium]|nr:complex I NDUFA9 subunit family protein [Armatimonadota bacterium]
MKVLVTGGTGFVGSHTVKRLVEAEHSVRVMARSERFVSKLRLDEVEFASGDVTIPDSLPAALKGIEAVVHCVGIIVEPRGVTFEKVVAEGARSLVQAAVEAGVSRFIYISALGTRAGAAARYHRTKWEAEETIRKSDLAFTILRPSIIFGPEDKFINFFLKFPVVVLPGGGRGRFQPIFVDDLARIVILSLTTPDSRNSTLDAGGPQQLTYREMMAIALKVSNQRKPMVPAPMAFMKLLATLHDPFQRIYLPLALFTHEQYLMMQEDNVGDNTLLLKTFPNLQLTTLEEGLRSYLGHSAKVAPSPA